MKLIVAFCFAILYVDANDNPGFFLKTSKNVPRIGRRSQEFENFFLKQSKSVPRIGRRDGYTIQGSNLDLQNIRPFDSSLVYSLLSNELSDDSNSLKFVSWSDFDRALESDKELYTKLKSLARDQEIDELKKFLLQAEGNNNEDNSVVGTPNAYHDEPIFHKYVPVKTFKNKPSKFNNNEVYYYRNEKKSDGHKEINDMFFEK